MSVWAFVASGLLATLIVSLCMLLLVGGTRRIG
jgi:hypothetical protein